MKTPEAAPSPGTRKAILDATRRILREEGMEGVTMRRLARELGMSAMAPCTYFPSRDVLLWTVSQEELAGLFPYLKQRGENSRDSVDRLRCFLRAFAECALAAKVA